VRALAPPLIGAATLVAALFGVVPVAAALIVVGLVGGGYGVTETLRPRRPAKSLRFAAAGLGFCGVSTLLAGLALAIAPDVRLSDVPLPAELPLIGLFFVTGMFLLGLFHLPGQSATYVGRLRRALDGVGVGIWVFLMAWLLVFESARLKGAALTAVLVASVAFGASVVGALRAVPVDRTAAPYGAGVLITSGGLTALILALDYNKLDGWTVAACVPLLAGSVLADWALRKPAGPESSERSLDGSFARYPLLAFPMAGALVAAAYHLVTVHRFDSVAATLAIAGVIVVAVREALAVADVRQYARKLAEREDRFRSLVIGSTDVTMMLDDALIVRWQSPAAARQLGLSDQDVVGHPLLARVHPDDADLVAGRLASARPGTLVLIEARLRDGFDTWRETEWSVSDQRAVGSVRALVVHVRDISQRRQLEHSLHRAASTDQLTGLANRSELRRALAARTAPGVLMLFGLDGLTSVNQLRGHEVGDAVIVEAARRLRALTGAQELCARPSGDQLAVVTATGAVQAQMMAGRLLTVLAEPYPVLGVESHLSVAAGLAEYPADGDADAALSRAELALQRARRPGPAQPPQWYDEATAALLRRRLSIEQDLPGALGRGEFDLLFQPILELPRRHAVGVEAQLRWRRPGLGTVPTAEFQGVVDQLGLHEQIGTWMLSAACRQLSELLAAGRELWLVVNSSTAHLASPGFPDTVTGVLNAHGIAPSRLVVQFSEDAVDAATGRAITEHLTKLQTLGIRTALDGFGAQATSLSRLRSLPLDIVKLDRRIFDAAPGAPDHHDAVVAAVVNLAEQLGVEVAVSGVRTEPELRASVNAGCRLGQGELFCPPAVPERLEAYLDTHRSATF